MILNKIKNMWPLAIVSVAVLAVGLQLRVADSGLRENLLSRANERIALAEVNLRQAANGLANDATLGEHLEWKLDHAVRTFIAGAIVPQVVDGIAVFDERCQLVAKAGVVSLGSCKHAGSQWQGIKSLSYLTSLQTKSKRSYTIATAVQIDKSWLADQLREADQGNWQIDLASITAIGNSKQKLGTLNFANAPALVLQVSPINYYFWLVSRQPALLLLLGLILATLFVAALVNRSNIRLLQHKLKFEEQRTRDLVKTLVLDDAELSTQVQTLDVAELVARHNQSFRNERQACAKKIAELDLALRKSTAVERSLSKKLDDLVNYEAMGLQLKSIMRRLSTDLEQMQSLSEDIVDTLVHGASRTLQAQWAMLRQWQIDTQNHGVRRVLKQMTETIMFDGATLFEHQLRQLTELEQQLEDQLVHATGFCQRLEKATKEADNMSSHWTDLTEESELAKPPTSILEVLMGAQAMVQRAAVNCPQFINQIDLNASVQALSKSQAAMPRPIWLSVMFHLYMSISEEALAGKCEIRSTIQQGIEESRLLFSITTDQETAQRIRNSAHLDVAERLARRYGMKTSLLRASAGNVVAIALAWHQDQDPLQQSSIGDSSFLSTSRI